MVEKLKVLVCGDRNWTNRDSIAKRLRQLPRHTEVIHGGARGADMIAGDEAFKLGLTVHVFPADWDKYGRAAGPIRNQIMIDQKPNLVIAFHSNIKNSRGTADTIRRAKAADIPVYIVTE